MPLETHPYILSVDIGTSGIRASVFDGSGNELPGVRSESTVEGGAELSELDAAHLLDRALSVLDETESKCRETALEPSFAAVSCFWHSLLGIDEKGSAVTPVFLWSETRAGTAAERLRRTFRGKRIHDRTGCHFHSSFWPAKLIWIREELPDRFSRAVRWISFSDFFHHRLTGELATSVSMASGTGLFDIRKCGWDPELVTACGLYPADLAPIAADDECSELTRENKDRWPAFRESKWIPAIGDGAANNIGADCVSSDRASLMVGTSAAMRIVYEGEVPDRIPEGLFCYRLDRRRVVLGGALSDGGSLYGWLKGLLGDRICEDTVTDRYRSGPAGYHGLSFLPFVFGERSTGYHSEAEGAVIGLTRGTDAADISIAAMESIAFRLVEILTRMEEVSEIRELSASGGAVVSSPLLTTILADVLGRDLRVSKAELASLRGAAIFGLEASGANDPSRSSADDDITVIAFDPRRHSLYERELIRHRKFYRRAFPE